MPDKSKNDIRQIALGREEGISTKDLQREDIEVLDSDSISVVKAINIGLTSKDLIAEKTGMTRERVERIVAKLESRGFVRNYKDEVRLTKKGGRLFVRKFDMVGPLMFAGFFLTFFLGVIELSRFLLLFAPLKFDSTPSGFWILFYSKASWLDLIWAGAILLLSFGMGYALIERMYRKRVMLNGD